MILADKIIDLRKKNGWSQEELAEMLEVSRQSISKWESAQSTPDMNRILKISELFGVSTDYLLKDEMELQATEALPAVESSKVRSISMEEASAFLSYKDYSSGRIALGVMLCILSPVLVIVLSALQAGGIIHMTETAAVGIGLVVLLLLVGSAVALFLTTSFKGQSFEYLEKEEIDTAYGVDGMVKERRENFRSTYSTHLTIGILLCVVSALPIFFSMIFYGENNVAIAVSVGFLLILAAIGVLLIVHSSMIWGGYQMLLQEGDYTAERKAETKKFEPLATIYWCSATALYLAISFIGGAWDKSWIVWPIAGVVYGVVLAVARVLKK